jgi:hypothetical protein
MIIRQIMACERDRVKEFYFAFSAEDHRKRFSYTLADATVSKYVDSFDFARCTIFGAFNAHAELIGLAELAPGTTESELAFSVRPDMRCRRVWHQADGKNSLACQDVWHWEGVRDIPV